MLVKINKYVICIIAYGLDISYIIVSYDVFIKGYSYDTLADH